MRFRNSPRQALGQQKHRLSLGWRTCSISDQSARGIGPVSHMAFQKHFKLDGTLPCFLTRISSSSEQCLEMPAIVGSPPNEPAASTILKKKPPLPSSHHSTTNKPSASQQARVDQTFLSPLDSKTIAQFHLPIENMSIPINQAAWLDNANSPLVIREAPMPSAGPNEIVVKNHAVAINPLDNHMQDIGVFVQQWPAILGCDVAGEVFEVGSGVDRFRKGDRVIG